MRPAAVIHCGRMHLHATFAAVTLATTARRARAEMSLNSALKLRGGRRRADASGAVVSAADGRPGAPHQVQPGCGASSGMGQVPDRLWAARCVLGPGRLHARMSPASCAALSPVC